MRTIVTVTKGRRQGQQYVCSVNAPAVKFVKSEIPAGNTPEEAAARAMECAAKWGYNGFTVFAPREVLTCIPKDMQNRAE